ncbi:protein translocase subunit SecF [Leucobacter sp. cx-42]|uniref:protein translocase subunit SecF n=1 Tax=unclassified Leucobacter TaxID=2621730 RepID=UPI00165DA347|nr:MULTISPECIES: protein translocase subunit SecF [unclassified Leucobacter]MBC9954813.1 protein translocase subunit SecF [Leucobacter sp. cx-42]
MARSFSEFGNALYTGEKSINFIGKRKIWYILSIVLIALAVIGPIARGGFSFGIEFTGGSQFQVHLSESAQQDPKLAEQAVAEVLPNTVPKITKLGPTDIRVQTEALQESENVAVTNALATAYDVKSEKVTYSYVGPAWGQDITKQAIIALIVFILLAALVMAIYFRTWKMSIAALTALLHDLIITAGIYGLAGFEITPAAMIGFLTILGYSLYDTVVVFDKIRENTTPGELNESRTFAESVNLAVNQTLVRSINTSVVALLPVGSILFIGAFVLGAGTLRDISLALFIGILVGAYSTIFIAAPVYSQLREKDKVIVEHDKKVLRQREREEDLVAAEATE